MDKENYGVFRVGELCSIDIDKMIEAVKEKSVEITVTMEPDRTEISVQPWRPYRPTCPYAEIKEAADADKL
jgi:hypothetical protein